mmetsp:Transcript_27905/g.36298  ORF Transcript_27905/g.36298 Transcript_27905/m.36298 type:complete len:268 (-) Transcript_27905:170-973(-)
MGIKKQCVHYPCTVEGQCLPESVLSKIFSYTLLPKEQNLLNKTFNDQTNESCSSLIFSPFTPRDLVLQIASKRINTEILVLDKVESIDDSSLKLILSVLTKLQILSLAYCTKVTLAAFENAHPRLKVKSRGCWRIATPSPLLSAFEVTELQLIALQQNEMGSSEGIQSAGKFSTSAAHCYNALTVNEMSEGLRSIVNCISFSIRVLGRHERLDSLRRSYVYVRVHTKDSSVQHFVWDLVKQQGGPFPGCWLVHSVRSVSVVHRSLDN